MSSDLAKHKEQRVGVFVDVQNMYYSARNLHNAKANFLNILKDAVADRNLIRAFAYVIKADIPEEKTFWEALEKGGFEIRSKDLQTFAGGNKKGDWDVGLTVDAIRLSPKLDVIVLVSGDGDYVDLIEYLKMYGHRGEVMAFRQTASGKLIEEADDFIDLSSNKRRYLIPNRNRPATPRKPISKN